MSITLAYHTLSHTHLSQILSHKSVFCLLPSIGSRGRVNASPRIPLSRPHLHVKGPSSPPVLLCCIAHPHPRTPRKLLASLPYLVTSSLIFFLSFLFALLRFFLMSYCFIFCFSFFFSFFYYPQVHRIAFLGFDD